MYWSKRQTELQWMQLHIWICPDYLRLSVKTMDHVFPFVTLENDANKPHKDHLVKKYEYFSCRFFGSMIHPYHPVLVIVSMTIPPSFIKSLLSIQKMLNQNQIHVKWGKSGLKTLFKVGKYELARAELIGVVEHVRTLNKRSEWGQHSAGAYSK